MEPVERWERLAGNYRTLPDNLSEPTTLSWLQRFPNELSREEIEWFVTGLGDESQKRFVLSVLMHHNSVPEWSVSPLLRAAVYELCPSSNRDFIVPVQLFYGRRRVYEELLAFAHDGSDFEKAGAINAFYWAPMSDFWGWWGFENIVLEDDITDLKERVKNYLMLEFVTNSNLAVRRNAISLLELKTESYPEELHQFIPQAIEIARGHQDSYIRHRIEIQLGGKGPFQALPHRDKPARENFPDDKTPNSLARLMSRLFKRSA